MFNVTIDFETDCEGCARLLDDLGETLNDDNMNEALTAMTQLRDHRAKQHADDIEYAF